MQPAPQHSRVPVNEVVRGWQQRAMEGDNVTLRQQVLHALVLHPHLKHLGVLEHIVGQDVATDALCISESA
eukprot:scaffold111621_cov22-Tisochrysis_lutea.AAC.1